MEIHKQPTTVSITFSPEDYWLKVSDDYHKGDYMLVHKIDMSYKGKEAQEGMPVLYLTRKEMEVFREAGFAEIL